MQSRSRYDESVYLHALKHRGSPLIAGMAANSQWTYPGSPDGLELEETLAFGSFV